MEVRPAKLKCDHIENTGNCFFFLFSAEIKWLPLNCTFLLEQTQIHKTTLSLLKGLNLASCDFLVCLSLSVWRHLWLSKTWLQSSVDRTLYTASLGPLMNPSKAPAVVRHDKHGFFSWKPLIRAELPFFRGKPQHQIITLESKLSLKVSLTDSTSKVRR